MAAGGEKPVTVIKRLERLGHKVTLERVSCLINIFGAGTFVTQKRPVKLSAAQRMDMWSRWRGDTDRIRFGAPWQEPCVDSLHSVAAIHPSGAAANSSTPQRPP